jgi:hypothetical protein
MTEGRSSGLLNPDAGKPAVKTAGLVALRASPVNEAEPAMRVRMDERGKGLNSAALVHAGR